MTQIKLKQLLVMGTFIVWRGDVVLEKRCHGGSEMAMLIMRRAH
jgi:hypothetical protein